MGERLGLVRGTNTVRFGLALGVGLWLVVVALSLVEGVTDRLFELSVIGGHARLLLVIPLLFVCESWVAPLMTAFVATIASNGVVPPRATPALDAEVRRANRLANAWWPDAACLLIAIALAFTGSRLHTYGETAVPDAPRTALAAQRVFPRGRDAVSISALSLGLENCAVELVSLAGIAARSLPDAGPPRSCGRPRVARGRA